MNLCSFEVKNKHKEFKLVVISDPFSLFQSRFCRLRTALTSDKQGMNLNLEGQWLVQHCTESTIQRNQQITSNLEQNETYGGTWIGKNRD